MRAPDTAAGCLPAAGSPAGLPTGFAVGLVTGFFDALFDAFFDGFVVARFVGLVVELFVARFVGPFVGLVVGLFGGLFTAGPRPARCPVRVVEAAGRDTFVPLVPVRFPAVFGVVTVHIRSWVPDFAPRHGRRYPRRGEAASREAVRISPPGGSGRAGS
ncbi:hypothetical protein [Streptomyces sp. NPDC007264]|uniref:hypothetical protein n=1 Tax=Streptomyces sp. NPDC007264 TaxID=3364777 RepID=UPI0036D76165